MLSERSLNETTEAFVLEYNSLFEKSMFQIKAIQ